MLRGLKPMHPGEFLREVVLPALGKLCGNDAEIWLNLQRTYELAIEEKRLSAELKKIPTLRAADEAA